MSSLFDDSSNLELPALPVDHKRVIQTTGEEMVKALDELKKYLGQNDLATLVNSVIEKQQVGNSLPKGVPPEMIKLLKNFVDKAPAPARAEPAQARQARRFAAAQFLVDVLRNEFKSPGARWAANLTNTSLRTGIVVTLCILLREGLAFTLSKNEALGENETVMQAAGISMIGLTLALNVIGLATDFYRKDKKSKLGSSYSMVMRLGMCVFSLSILLTCYFRGTLSNLVTRTSAFLTYCYARDLCNLFLKLGNNVASLPKKALLGSGAIYGVVQFLASFLPDQAAPLAGAGGVPKVGQIGAGNFTITLEDVAATGLNLPQTYLKAMINALADVSDDVIAPAMLRAAERPSLLAKSDYQRYGETAFKEHEAKLAAWAGCSST